jgi:DNA-binding MurR/RpiR family transcriptional regulator
MLKIDETKLNLLEKRVLEALKEYSKKNDAPRIIEAAGICKCSVSVVSKAVKKAGFSGYKQFIRYLYYEESPQKEPTSELNRIKQIIDDFDASLIDELVKLILSHKKIFLFGFGPSFICAQYIEYKLRFCINSFIAVPPDEASLRNLLDDKSLLIILTATGKYRSFKEITDFAESKGADAVIVSEEFNPALMENCDRYFFLSRHNQSDALKPHQKTRTAFFIFFEEVIHRIILKEREK